MTHPRFSHPRGRRGSVLILALVMLIVLTSMVLMLARSMRTEELAAANYAAELQADATAHGAAEYLREQLNGTQGWLPDDSTLYAQGVQIGPGYFWLLKHDLSDTSTSATGTYTFGLTDEAGKINLNYSGVATTGDRPTSATTLSLLPNMTTDIANNIVAWQSAPGASSSGGGGAQSSYYLTLPTPYQAKNANFESVEELLMVEGVTPDLLYGSDTNRNGVLDANDNSPNATPGVNPGVNGSAGSPSTAAPGVPNLLAGPGMTQTIHGLADYVTVYSNEPNTSSTGQRRLDVNVASRTQLQQAFQSAGMSSGRISTVLNIAVPTRGGRPTFANVIDFYYKVGLQPADFKQIADRISTTTATTLPGLVNINTAPQEVLASMAGLTTGDAQSIIAYRQSNGGFTDLSPLVTVLSQAKATAIGGRVTVRSFRCSADIVAADASGRAFKRYQVVFSTIATPPTILYWRDLTSLGWPLDGQILTDLRAGKLPTMGMGTGSTTTVNQMGTP